MDLLTIAIGAAIGCALTYAFSKASRNHNPEHQRQANEIANRFQKWHMPLLHGVFEELAMGNQKGVFRQLRPLHRTVTDEDQFRELLFGTLKEWLPKFLDNPKYEKPLFDIINQFLAAKTAIGVSTPTQQVVNGVTMIGPSDGTHPILDALRKAVADVRTSGLPPELLAVLNAGVGAASPTAESILKVIEKGFADLREAQAKNAAPAPAST